MDLSNYKIKTPTKKFKANWEVEADELTTYFNRNCFWLYHKYEDWKILNAYKVCKEKGIDSFNYLLGILRK